MRILGATLLLAGLAYLIVWVFSEPRPSSSGSDLPRPEGDRSTPIDPRGATLTEGRSRTVILDGSQEERPEQAQEARARELNPRNGSEVSDGILQAEIAEWTALYADAGTSELDVEIKELRQALNDGTKPYYMEQLRLGNYIIEGQSSSDGKYQLPRLEDELSMRRFAKGGEVQKVVLPPNEFPQLYSLHRRIRWLTRRRAELSLGIAQDVGER